MAGGVLKCVLSYIFFVGVEGFELVVSYYSKHYTFKRTEGKVPFPKFINSLRVRLYSDEGSVFVYELKGEPFIYLVEIEPRGSGCGAVNLEMIKLNYYFGEDEPEKEPLGYITVGSCSVIGLLIRDKASDLVDTLARWRNWRVSL